ncbi:MAG: hypothetical protein FJ027_19470 [Candidatus Rokubacteria bacterium]|nr:hypothetical protein [Candidatus Rokubacteria bacterium]
MPSRRRSRPARRPPSPPVAGPAAEPLLLALAQALSARAAALTTADLHALIEMTFAAYGADTPLAAALRADWLRARGDKTAGLALGWAREQVRLALAEALARGRAEGVVRRDGDLDTLAWLWLAACEALAHDVPAAAPDRVQALAAFLAVSSRC